MELYAERLRLAAQAEAEAGGESLWTKTIPKEARVKIFFAWTDLPLEAPAGVPSVWDLAQYQVRRSLGTTRAASPTDAFTRFDVDTTLSYIEAAVRALAAVAGSYEYPRLSS